MAESLETTAGFSDARIKVAIVDLESLSNVMKTVHEPHYSDLCLDASKMILGLAREVKRLNTVVNLMKNGTPTTRQERLTPRPMTLLEATRKPPTLLEAACKVLTRSKHLYDARRIDMQCWVAKKDGRATNGIHVIEEAAAIDIAEQFLKAEKEAVNVSV